MSVLQKIALIVTIIGGINWGLIAIFDFNLVTFLFGDMTIIARLIYIAVGITALANLALLMLKNDHELA